MPFIYWNMKFFADFFWNLTCFLDADQFEPFSDSSQKLRMLRVILILSPDLIWSPAARAAHLFQLERSDQQKEEVNSVWCKTHPAGCSRGFLNVSEKRGAAR